MLSLTFVFLGQISYGIELSFVKVICRVIDLSVGVLHV